jgi:ABC-type transport system involved in multi-copper enzyme maturation permease subunit
MQTIKKLIVLEWLKFSKNPVVRALFAGFIVLFPFAILSGKEVFKNTAPPFPHSSIFYEFPTVWDYQGYAGNWLVSFFLGFMMIHVITSEVSNRTMRQNIIIGMNRTEFFLSKLLSMTLLSGIATTIYYISSLIMGMIHTEGWDLPLAFDNNFAGFRFFLMCMGYLSFAMMISYVLRRGSLSLLMYFSMMMFIEPIVRGIYFANWQNQGIKYFPLNTIEDLMPLPVLRIPEFFKNDNFNFDLLLPFSHAIMLSLAWISLFIFISWRNFKKKDI